MSYHPRPLRTNEDVEDFLSQALDFNYKKIRGIVQKIVAGELGVKEHNDKEQTLTNKSMRDKAYRDDISRWELRKMVIEELITMNRLMDDDKIRIGKGGALPTTQLKSEREAIIIIGLPAAGKSTIANKIADDYGAIIVDSDYAKRKLPEYKDYLHGDSIVHSESSAITYGFGVINPNDTKSLFERCIDLGHNIIVPRIGQIPGEIIGLTKNLTDNKGYKVHLILASLPKREATIRAIFRFKKSKRYVPLGLIFDWYANEPSHCYYYLRSKHQGLFCSLGVLSTLENPPFCTDLVGNSPVLKYIYKDVILQIP